jgi:hypothetical protein
MPDRTTVKYDQAVFSKGTLKKCRNIHMRKTKDQINARAFKHGKWCAKVRLAIERSWPSSRASPLQNSDYYIQF